MLSCLVATSTLASGVAAAEPELSLRLHAWGSLAAGKGHPKEGVLGQVSVSPALEFGDVVYLAILGGATTKVSSLSAQVWNNSVEPRVAGGIRVALPLWAVIRNAWSSAFVGVRHEWFVYYAGGQEPRARLVAFAELMLGLDWRCLGQAPGCGGRGAPLFARLEISTPHEAQDRSTALEAVLEQGLELAELGGGRMAPLVGAELKRSDRAEEFWNNHLDVRLGVRWRAQATPLPKLYGSLNVELRAGGRFFTATDRTSEWRGLVLLGFGLFGQLAAL